VPVRWVRDERIMYLMEHRWLVGTCSLALKTITSNLIELGYMEDTNKMVHDYLDYMIQDLLDKNGEVYLTDTELHDNEAIKALLGGGTMPDFIIKKNGSRLKTIILDVYVGDTQESEIKEKYDALTFFTDPYIVTQHNFQKQLASVLPATDIDYLSRNFQIFMAEEYYYWRKFLVKESPRIMLQSFPEISVHQQQAVKDKYIADLAIYATNVANRDNI
jgi:hypothetical protein